MPRCRSSPALNRSVAKSRKERIVLKKTIATVGEVRVVAMDSISYIDETDHDAVVVSASHGGTSSGEYATRHPAVMVIFNDAGVGKDQAGTQALKMLDALNVPAATVAHTSARIGCLSRPGDRGCLRAPPG